MLGKGNKLGSPGSTTQRAIKCYLRRVIRDHSRTHYRGSLERGLVLVKKRVHVVSPICRCVSKGADPFILVAVVIAEKALIEQIRRLAGPVRNPAVLKGIGDDCAVLRLPRLGGRQADVLVTTDFSLEGVHFRREWHSPESVGYRCLARGLSDIAAMGGTPVAAFLSLALPRDLPQSWVRRFMQGLANLAGRYGVPLAGGDTAESPRGILADIMVVGSVPKGKALLRSGAQPGDRIYVSGELGGSAAAVGEMEKKSEPASEIVTRVSPPNMQTWTNDSRPIGLDWSNRSVRTTPTAAMTNSQSTARNASLIRSRVSGFIGSCVLR